MVVFCWRCLEFYDSITIKLYCFPGAQHKGAGSLSLPWTSFSNWYLLNGGSEMFPKTFHFCSLKDWQAYLSEFSWELWMHVISGRCLDCFLLCTSWLLIPSSTVKASHSSHVISVVFSVKLKEIGFSQRSMACLLLLPFFPNSLSLYESFRATSAFYEALSRGRMCAC